MKNQLDNIYEEHEERLKNYYEKTGLNVIRKKTEEVNTSYQKREELIKKINHNITIILNHISNRSLSFKDEITFRNKKVYKYNSNEEIEDLSNYITNIEFWDTIINKNNNEELKEIKHFIDRYVPEKSLKKNYNRSYNTSINRENGTTFFSNNRNIYNFYLQYTLDTETDNKEIDPDNGDPKEFNIVKAKEDSLNNKSSIPLNKKTTITIPKPTDNPSKNKVYNRVLLSNEMLFIVETALNEVNYDIYILEKLRDKLREDFGGLVILDTI